MTGTVKAIGSTEVGVAVQDTTPLLQSRYKSNGTNGFANIVNGHNKPGHHTGFNEPQILECDEKSMEKPDDRKQSSLVTIFSVWNTVMGSSLLTMAWGVERAGLPAALLLMVAMGGLCLYTAYLLLTVNRHHGGAGGCEVQELCRRLLGRWAEALAHVFSLIVLLGANLVYWILITNFLYYTVNFVTALGAGNSTSTTPDNSSVVCRKLVPESSEPAPVPTPDAPLWALHSTVPLYVAFILYPLLNFKNSAFFAKFSSLGTLSILYLIVFVVWKAWAWGLHVGGGEPGGQWARGAKDAAVLSGMLALSFYIHNIIITIMANNRHQENNGRDLTLAFILVTVTYLLVGAVFYICFPLAKDCIEDNILNNFEQHDVMTAVARAGLLFQVVTVYPLIAFLLRAQLLALVAPRYQRNTAAILLLNLVLVVVCILAACFCPNIGTIIRYTGAVSGLVHVFALPALLQLRSLHLRRQLSCTQLLLHCVILLCGVLNLLAQFFITD